jgi:hypothetical protein
MNTLKRIDQYLFLDIVRQSYEAEKAWNIYITKYIKQSEKERNAYKKFSQNIKEKDKVFDMWNNMSDEQQNKYINETEKLFYLFSDVSTFLSIFQHNI